MVDLGSTVYMLNPSGDLASTQAEFADTFRRQPGWQVAAFCHLLSGFRPALKQPAPAFMQHIAT
jgi:hypothetical protein